MKNLNYIITTLTLSIFVLVSQHSYAASSGSHLEAAGELFEVMNPGDHTTKVLNQIVEMQIASMKQQGIPCIDLLKPIMNSFYQKRLNRDEMKKHTVPIYVEAYTEDEINELIAFYKSPVGRKTIETMPLVMQKSAAFTQQIMQQHKHELTLRIQNTLEENCKELKK